MEVDRIGEVDELQQMLTPVRRVSPRIKLGKRVRGFIIIIEVLSTQDFSPEIRANSIDDNIKDTEIARLNKLLKE
jgi:hypothetical protein